MRSPRIIAAAITVLVGLATAAGVEQRTDVFVDSIKHPAIAYATAPVHDAVAELGARLDRGAVRLALDPGSGYLRSILEALNIAADTQSLVFSQASAQAKQIDPRNPRGVYFNDSVAVGWVRGADVLELAAQDRQQGVVFYTLEQAATAAPRPRRDDSCLLCHLTWDTLGVPGLQMLSTFQMSDDPHAYASGLVVDHRTPLHERWGGWYVTGKSVPARHLGNVPVIVRAEQLGAARRPPPRFDTVADAFDTAGYPSRTSDVVALMVLSHQTHMTNLLTRVGWEARVMDSRGTADRSRVREAARDLADYMLFIDEAPIPARIDGSSGFAQRFSALGPRDTQGRSLRQLDLERRLMRYPCSYMIYTDAFDALPPVAKDAIYTAMWRILSGEEKDPRYARLAAADRHAIVEILRDTKTDLPDYFRDRARELR